MNLCNRCTQPGACCKKMRLWFPSDGQPQELTFWKSATRENVVAELRRQGLPFEPMEIAETWTHRADDADNGREYVAYRYTCPKLGDNGRCTIYRKRPKTCRDYKPASDELCVMFVKTNEETKT